MSFCNTSSGPKQQNRKKAFLDFRGFNLMEINIATAVFQENSWSQTVSYSAISDHETKVKLKLDMFPIKYMYIIPKNWKVRRFWTTEPPIWRSIQQPISRSRLNFLASAPESARVPTSMTSPWPGGANSATDLRKGHTLKPCPAWNTWNPNPVVFFQWMGFLKFGDFFKQISYM